ncbi:uncharacterized protein LACBIDRAFT_328825 [Laccaria bicolor S238N-H82]|uniref:Predicted protein n=1 Tax=Laccaria bicolor (strain S238N-H82 / ATCC MYA-4686) TaxID=486041 RepID=B0DG39_LACBS|nr:uncharacterized protein LACBIDRAFT_328825 [Laccaria bicolor S238N-H82]EDR06447.1 predicted protein [Laccaria bicolor S238N-H82]|eukprot:XP_001882819.1 predicted protein [Laccaria bicolor S238N-H82]
MYYETTWLHGYGLIYRTIPRLRLSSLTITNLATSEDEFLACLKLLSDSSITTLEILSEIEAPVHSFCEPFKNEILKLLTFHGDRGPKTLCPLLETLNLELCVAANDGFLTDMVLLPYQHHCCLCIGDVEPCETAVIVVIPRATSVPRTPSPSFQVGVVVCGADIPREMSTSKIPVAPTNLRERIAALEQRNAASDQRPTSPVALSAANTSPSAGGLRDKIAKFERKGGTPVPRGSFGLGAPPPTEGQPRRKGELYGNRIPVPVRMASSGVPPVSRSGSASPRVNGSPNPSRRSFSLSSISGDFDDGTDYTPLTSPTLTSPPPSPPDSVSFTPEISTSPTSLVDASSFKKPLLRGTDFAKALDIARKTEAGKLNSMPDGLGIRQYEEESNTSTPQVTSTPLLGETDLPEHTPAIVVSSEGAPMVVVQESPALDTHSFTAPQNSKVVEDDAGDLVSQVAGVNSAVLQLDTEVKVNLVTVGPKLSSTKLDTAHPIVNLASPVDTPLPPADHTSGVTTPLTKSTSSLSIAVASESITEEPNTTGQHVPPPIDIPSAESRERYSAASITIVVESPSSAPLPSTPDSEPSPALSEKTLSTGQHAPSPIDIPSAASPERYSATSITIVVESPSSAPPPSDSEPSPTLSEKTLSGPVSVEIEDRVYPTYLGSSESLPAPNDKGTRDVLSTPTVVISQPPPVFEESSITQDTSSPSPSSTAVLTNGALEEEISGPTIPLELLPDLTLRKNALTLDVDRLNDESLISSGSAGSVLASSALEGNLSVTDVLGGYYGSGKSAPGGQVEEPASNVVTPPKAQAQSAPSRHPLSFRSPTDSGLLSPAPSATSFTSSSLDTNSTTSSRPSSMIETSPSRVTLAHRLTPATSRGVPMFVPPTSSLPHKSDFSHFPPTPESARENFGSVVVHHKPSHSYSHPNTSQGAAAGEQSDAGSMARPTFSAVVHGKVREGPPSAFKPRVLPQTPQTNRIKRATILQTPLSPGSGELADLLQNAIFLEDTLEKGEDPGEAAKRLAEEEKQEKAKKEQEAAAAKAQREREEKERAALAQAEAEARKEGSNSAKLKHTFLIPLSKAKAVHRKEVSSSVMEGSANLRPQPEVVRPKSANPESHTRERKLGMTTDTPKEVSHRSTTPTESKDKTIELPTKSPRSRFASFRRLGSLSRSSKDGNGPARHSMSMSSEISSDDSAPAVTPPDHGMEFSSLMTPGTAELTPEKDRTEKVSSIGPPPPFSLPPLPTVTEPEESRPTTPSASQKKLRALPALPSSAVAPSQPNTPYTQQQKLPTPKIDYLSSPRDSLLPVFEDPSRPESWMSASSLSSVLPSPLFDKDIWDAFPPVPGGAPMESSSHTYGPTTTQPSFDSALLSSAIHLHKGTIGSSTGTTYNAQQVPRS